jgi:hypothetical protein
MTGTSARNHIGIFKSKRTKLFAARYSLDLHNKNAYGIDNANLISYYDVKFIVDNLWLDHFMYDTDKPIDVSIDEYNDIYYSLLESYPELLNFSYA